MSEAERIALYQKDHEACARRTQDYMQRTKRPTHPASPSPSTKVVACNQNP
jgi:hypothetical protein